MLMFAVIGAVLFATPASADGASTMTDRCVQTTVSRSGQTILEIRVYNVCDYTLGMVDGHAFNTSAGLDVRSGARIDLRAGQSFGWAWMGGWPTPAAYGSWTCGEIWGPGGYLYGRDCVQMGNPA